MGKRCFVDIHVIQTVPPSCVNRDDTGSPKTASYGGCIRARVSSQAWKRAVRQEFIRSGMEIGIRTMPSRIVGMLTEEISSRSPKGDPGLMAKRAMKLAGFDIEVPDEEEAGKDNEAGKPAKKTKAGASQKKEDQKKEDKKEALFFISRAQIVALADLAVAGCKSAKDYKDALVQNPRADMVFFGRMVASGRDVSYDACVQVAHAISTHRVQTEYDYFTAVDDCKPEDSAGSAFLGTVEYNSATLYRYATVDVMSAAKWLGEETPDLVRRFVEAFVVSMPTGKQNTFANRTLPDAVYLAIREDQPVNLCGAFEKPVRPDHGLVDASMKALAGHASKLYQAFANPPALALSTVEGAAPEGTKILSFPGCLAEMEDAIAGYLG